VCIRWIRCSACRERIPHAQFDDWTPLLISGCQMAGQARCYSKDSSISDTREEDDDGYNPVSPLEIGEENHRNMDQRNIFNAEKTESESEIDKRKGDLEANDNDPQDGWHTVRVGRETLNYEATATGQTRSGKVYKSVEEVSAYATDAISNIYAPLYDSDEDIDEEADPKTFEEAWNHHTLTERQGWREAIQKEFKDMNSRNVWKKIKKDEVPPNKRLIGCKWIFKNEKGWTISGQIVRTWILSNFWRGLHGHIEPSDRRCIDQDGHNIHDAEKLG
jgi:hypothetical protein